MHRDTVMHKLFNLETAVGRPGRARMGCAGVRSALTQWVRLRAVKKMSVHADFKRNASGQQPFPGSITQKAHYLWSVLIARIYAVFPLLCSNCGGQMRLIAFITHNADIRQILDHIGVESERPHITPARRPLQWEGCEALMVCKASRIGIWWHNPHPTTAPMCTSACQQSLCACQFEHPSPAQPARACGVTPVDVARVSVPPAVMPNETDDVHPTQ